VKFFVGTSSNAVKSQIFVALIAYLLPELLRRLKAMGKTAISNFSDFAHPGLGRYQFSMLNQESAAKNQV
jgi:hypothetical protein